MKNCIKILMLAVTAFCGWTIAASPISGEQAREAVAAWMHFRGRTVVPVGVRSMTNPASRAQVHKVSLSNGGCVFAAGDDRSMPIKAIVDEDADAIDEEHPLVRILLADAAAEVQANKVPKRSLQVAAGSADPTGVAEDPYAVEQANAEQSWRRLLSGAAANSAGGGRMRLAAQSSSATKVILDDTVIIPAILKTKWGQSTHNNEKDERLGGGGIACYNSKCPELVTVQPSVKSSGEADVEEEVQNVNALCGCVATAGAQLMKKWERPSWTTFKWGKMKNDPKTACSKDCCDAIGTLTRAVADTCVIKWGLKETSGNSAAMVSALKGTFKYTSAEWTMNPAMGPGSDGMSEFNRLAVSEIIGKRPVILAIHRDGGGHCVVADGYCILDNQHYLHINLGWNKGGAWYRPPVIKNYTSVEGIGHNIDPSQKKSILGVLVVNELGTPISNATVEWKSGSKVLVSARTNAKGIVAINLNSCSPGTTTVEASIAGVSSGAASVLASTDDSPRGDFKVLVIPQAGVWRQLPKPTIETVELKEGRFRFKMSGAYSASDNVRIYYTMDDSVPAEDSELYEGVTGYQYSKQADVTVKAKAFADGWISSETAELTVTVPPVTSASQLGTAIQVQATSGGLVLRNGNARTEASEPAHSPVGKAGGASMWVNFTPDAAGDYTFTASGETDGVDPQLAVYRLPGRSPSVRKAASISEGGMSALVRVAANDDANVLDFDYSSRVAFTAVAGESYLIAVDTANGAKGDISLSWEPGRDDAVEPAESEIFCDDGGGTFSVPVYSTADWKVVFASDWLNLSRSSGRNGESLQIDVPALSADASPRVAHVLLSAADGSVSGLRVEQSPTRWVHSRTEAMETAAVTGKRVLMVCGRDACSNTTYMRLTACEDSRIKPLLAAGYVLWYCNCDTDMDEYADYEKGLGGYTLPLVCIVDPANPSAYVARSTGFLSISALQSFLQTNAESTQPTAPAGVTAVGAVVAPAGVSLSWQSGRRANSYEIWRGTVWDEAHAVLVGQTSGLVFEDDEVDPGTLYWYRVRSVNGAGRSAFSAAVGACAKVGPDGGDQTLANAVGAPQLAWTTGSDVPWTVQTTNVWSGGTALQSGAVTSSAMPQTSTLKATVTGPTRLSFRYLPRLTYYGQFDVMVDGASALTARGIRGEWTLASLEIPAGTHEIAFVFAKYYAGYYNQPTYVCLDDVRLGVASEPPTFAVSTTDEEGTAASFCAKMHVTLNVPSGGTVYYTTDGSEPTTDSAVYENPFAITCSTRIRAVCVQLGHDVSMSLAGLYLERHPAVPGEWTTDVAGVRAAGLTNGNLIVTVLANHDTCSYSRAFRTVATDSDFLAWARENGVYLLSADSSLHVDAQAAQSHFWTLFSSAGQSGYAYYPALAVATAWHPDEAIGYDIARTGNMIGGVTYAGDTASLKRGLATYLKARPVNFQTKVTFTGNQISDSLTTQTYVAGKPFGALPESTAPSRYGYYAFLGWCKTRWGELTPETMLSESTIVPYSDLVVYERWQYGYVIKFLSGQGSGIMLRQGCESGRVYSLAICTFSPPAGKRFAGWACSNGRRYDDGMLVFDLAKPGETVTMTAIWEDL